MYQEARIILGSTLDDFEGAPYVPNKPPSNDEIAVPRFFHGPSGTFCIYISGML